MHGFTHRAVRQSHLPDGDRRAARHSRRRAARPRRAQRRVAAAAADLRHGAGVGHHPAVVDVLGRACSAARSHRSCSTFPASRRRSRPPSTAIRWRATAGRPTALATAFGSAGFGALVGVVLITLLGVLGRAGRAGVRAAGIFRGVFPGLCELHRHGRLAAVQDPGVARRSALRWPPSAWTRSRAACGSPSASTSWSRASASSSRSSACSASASC